MTREEALREEDALCDLEQGKFSLGRPALDASKILGAGAKAPAPSPYYVQNGVIAYVADPSGSDPYAKTANTEARGLAG
jgi:hypothetical protein